MSLFGVTSEEWRFAGAENLFARREEWRFSRDPNTKACQGVLVPSRSGDHFWCVRSVNRELECNCPDFQNRRKHGILCAHVIAVAMAIDEAKQR